MINELLDNRISTKYSIHQNISWNLSDSSLGFFNQMKFEESQMKYIAVEFQKCGTAAELRFKGPLDKQTGRILATSMGTISECHNTSLGPNLSSIGC
jgi:hypothetical protein